VLPSLAARMDAVIAEGFGARDFAVIAKDAIAGTSASPGVPWQPEARGGVTDYRS
jgi:hypothetical protein